MSNLEATIRVNVDATNPGQFFACCGLFELATRLWPASVVQATFSTQYFELHAASNELSLEYLIETFVEADVSELDSGDKAASRLYLGNPFNLRLDWWRRVETADKRYVDLGGGEQLKTWAGKQFGPLIFRLMKKACKGINLQALLDEKRAVYDEKDGKAQKKTISPFYFDARRNETSLDVGFSPDEQEMSVVVYPAVESLALIGLQRFRPIRSEGSTGRTFLYTVWSEPIPLVVAMAAVSGIVPVRSCGKFRFTKPSRGGDYLTMFSRAARENGNDV